MEINKMAILDYITRLEGMSGDWHIEQLSSIPAPPNLLSKVAEESIPKPTPPITGGVLSQITLIQITNQTNCIR